jgi:hypothetical protein
MTGTASTRNLDDIAEALRAAKDRGGKCTLLIGAGCSLGAGIPLSSGIVDDIRKTYPSAYKRAQERHNPP